VHPTCSITHLELAETLKAIATHLADDVEVPIGTTCCGTAGDRGLLHPELVVSATREVKAVLDARPAEAYISANRTCEMGLRHATGRGASTPPALEPRRRHEPSGLLSQCVTALRTVESEKLVA
jgi:Fe-S oxidoreductase